MHKKGEFTWGWEEISKLILIIVVLVIVILLIYFLKDKLIQLVEKIKDVFNVKR